MINNNRESDIQVSGAIATIIASRLKEAADYFGLGQLQPSYRCLKSIRLLIGNRFTSEENQNLVNQEKEIDAGFAAINHVALMMENWHFNLDDPSSFHNLATRDKLTVKRIISFRGDQLFEKYQLTLMGLLDSHGILSAYPT